MKKTLSVILTCILLLSTVFIAIPVSAAAEPIKATPLTGWTRQGYSYLTSTTATVTPLGWTTAQGVSVAPASGLENGTYSNTVVSSSKVYSCIKMDEATLGLSAYEAIIVYLKLDAKNTYMPKVIVTTATGGKKYLTLASGDNIQYMAKGDNQWTDYSAVFVGDEGTATIYNSGIKFDSAFEGYIKFKVSDLTNDSSANISDTDVLDEFQGYLEGIGGTYGNAVVGPYFLVTADSTSTEIEIPEEYKPEPIKATPVTDWTKLSGSWETSTTAVCTPLDWTVATGVSMTPSASLENGSYVVDYTAASKAYSGIRMNNSKTELDGAVSLMFYVKFDAANTFFPKIVAKNTAGNEKWMTVGAGDTIEYAAIGDKSWTKYSAVCLASETSTQTNAGIEFTEAFEGFIKLKISDLHTGWSTVAEGDTLYEIYGYIKGIGGTYGNAVVGPYFLVTADSTSTEIEIPDAYKPAPIETKTFELKNAYSAKSNFSVTAADNGYTLSAFDADSAILVDDLKLGSSSDANLRLVPAIPLAAKDSTGFIVYLKTDSKNVFSMSLKYEYGTHWSYGWDPLLYLRPGKTVSVLEKGSNTWEEKTVIEGADNTLIYGAVNFDGAFEGYIKIPYSALHNDQGWAPYTTGEVLDRIIWIDLRFKGIGGDYGTVTTELVGYITADSTSSVISAAAPEYEIGDVNQDWQVNATDLAELKKYLLALDAEVSTVDGNVNRDDTINILDLIALKKALN